MSVDGKQKLAPKPSTECRLTYPLTVALCAGQGFNTSGIDSERHIDYSLSMKRRADLTPVEKEKRRKIRNRIASQNSREKKKRLVEDLERRISALEEMNKKLIQENISLREKNSSLEKENTSLQRNVITSKNTPLVFRESVSDPSVIGVSASLGNESLSKSVLDSNHEKSKVVGTPKSAALGCISLQKKYLASQLSPFCLKATHSMTCSFLIKVLLIMSLMNSLPSSKTYHQCKARKLKRIFKAHSTPTWSLNFIRLIFPLVQSHPLKMGKWWRMYHKSWTPLKK